MKTPLKKAVSWLLLIATLTIAITWLAWLIGADPRAPGNASGAANAAIRPWRIPLMLCRWGLWYLVWYQWHWIGEKLFSGEANRGKEQHNHWHSMRIRMVGGIAFVEAIILFSYLTGG